MYLKKFFLSKIQCIIICSVNLFSQEIKNDTLTQTQISEQQTYYKSGELKASTPYLNGKVSGTEFIYYKNGKIKYEIYILDNIVKKGLMHNSLNTETKVMDHFDFIQMEWSLR